jgi:hypothetical protein
VDSRLGFIITAINIIMYKLRNVVSPVNIGETIYYIDVIKIYMNTFTNEAVRPIGKNIFKEMYEAHALS